MTFSVTNSGSLFHTFTLVPSDGNKVTQYVNVELAGGQGDSVTFIVPQGIMSLYYYCTVGGHEGAGMKGTITVSGGN